MVKLGPYDGEVRSMTMLLWGIQQPTLSKPNAFVSQASYQLSLDSCGHSLHSSIPFFLVTGGVRWDSGVVLGKFLEHSVDSGMLVFQGNNIVELGSGCGWVGYIAGLLDGEVIVFLYGFLLGSDVVYSEGDVLDLLETLVQLSGPNTTIFLAGELRNDAILEYFLETATDNFTIGRLDQKLWHPDYCSNRVVLYVLVKK
ncbi:hypothetical protein AAZX31_09G146300 [Glycine max]